MRAIMQALHLTGSNRSPKQAGASSQAPPPPQIAAAAYNLTRGGCDVPLFAHSMLLQKLACLLSTGHWLMVIGLHVDARCHLSHCH